MQTVSYHEAAPTLVLMAAKWEKRMQISVAKTTSGRPIWVFRG